LITIRTIVPKTTHYLKAIALNTRDLNQSLLIVGAIFVNISFLSYGAAAEVRNHEVGANSFGSSMADCTPRLLALFKSNVDPTLDQIKGSVDICYTLLNREDQLSEFAVRSKAYEQQYSANAILLWMVVAITIAGVILAGLQLLASYNLSVASGKALDQSNEITLARNQIVLKSSVTGLTVMLLSFAFFIVFVKYVYKIEDSDQFSQMKSTFTRGTIDAATPPK
jgi:hypothetical protein